MDICKVTDEDVEYWNGIARPAMRQTYACPPGMDDCDPAEVVSTRDPTEGGTVVRVYWRPDEIDLARLAEGGAVVLSSWGGLTPHTLQVI